MHHNMTSMNHSNMQRMDINQPSAPPLDSNQRFDKGPISSNSMPGVQNQSSNMYPQAGTYKPAEIPPVPQSYSSYSQQPQYQQAPPVHSYPQPYQQPYQQPPPQMGMNSNGPVLFTDFAVPQHPQLYNDFPSQGINMQGPYPTYPGSNNYQGPYPPGM